MRMNKNNARICSRCKPGAVARAAFKRRRTAADFRKQYKWFNAKAVHYVYQIGRNNAELSVHFADILRRTIILHGMNVGDLGFRPGKQSCDKTVVGK
jgi:hypothetical protein